MYAQKNICLDYKEPHKVRTPFRELTMDKWALVLKDFGLSDQLRELRLMSRAPKHLVALTWLLVVLVRVNQAALAWWLVIQMTNNK